MKRTCLKCESVNTKANGGQAEACPVCGAIYAKVEAAQSSGVRAAQAIDPLPPAPPHPKHQARATARPKANPIAPAPGRPSRAGVWLSALVSLGVVVGVATTALSRREPRVAALAPHPALKPTPEPEAERATARAISASVDSLVGEFKDNEIRAVEKYKGNYLRVSGSVTGVREAAFTSNPSVSLGSEDGQREVVVFMRNDQRQRATALQKGEWVIVDCRRVSKTLGMVQGSDCTF